MAQKAEEEERKVAGFSRFCIVFLFSLWNWPRNQIGDPTVFQDDGSEESYAGKHVRRKYYSFDSSNHRRKQGKRIHERTPRSYLQSL